MRGDANHIETLSEALLCLLAVEACTLSDLVRVINGEVRRTEDSSRFASCMRRVQNLLNGSLVLLAAELDTHGDG